MSNEKRKKKEEKKRKREKRKKRKRENLQTNEQFPCETMVSPVAHSKQ